jgi:hypothetical protein
MKKIAGLVLTALLFARPAAAIPPVETDFDRAESLISNSEFEAALSHLRAAVSQNPYDGLLWLYLGYVERRLENCRDAVLSFDRAIEAGVNGDRNFMAAAHRWRAGCRAESGETAGALDDLATAYWRWGEVDFEAIESEPAFASLLHLPAYAQLRGDLPEDVDRVAGWRADIERFETLMRRRHPHGAAITSRQAWRDAIQQLRAAVPHSTDLELTGAFMRLAALAGDGHTVIYPPSAGARAFRLLPVRTRRFADGWRITAAAPPHSSLIGARLIAIHGTPIEDAEAEMFSHLSSDNRFTHYWLGEVALQFAELSALVSGSFGNDSVAWRVETISGELLDVTFQARPIDRDPMAVQPPPGWASAIAGADPLWLAEPNATYRTGQLNGGNVLYVQLNAVADSGGTSLADFGMQIAEQAASAEKIILDLRLNRGGNGYLIEGFLRPLLALPQLQERGHFFVLIGRRTFSAAGELTGTLSQQTEAIFVGEPTAARPTLFASDTPFTLPYSGLSGSISSQFFANGRSSDDVRPWFSPDIHVPLTFNAIRDGRDPVLEAILESRPGHE